MAMEPFFGTILVSINYDTISHLYLFLFSFCMFSNPLICLKTLLYFVRFQTEILNFIKFIGYCQFFYRTVASSNVQPPCSLQIISSTVTFH